MRGSTRIHYRTFFIASATVTLLAAACSPGQPLSTVPTATPAPTSGLTAIGRVVAGYGAHEALADEPLWIGESLDGTGVATRTDASGRFTLTNLAVGLVEFHGIHPSFQVSITTAGTTVDMGVLHYPLIHPPAYYYWTAAPEPNLEMLNTKGDQVAFKVCKSDSHWERPAEQLQETVVWSQRPFSDSSGANSAANSSSGQHRGLTAPAVLYDTIDFYEQSFPGGPNLDPLAAELRYGFGLWTAGDPLSSSACSYDGHELDELLERKQLELWLLGYRATSVSRLDKLFPGYDAVKLCDPTQRSCTERLGDHFAIQAVASPGYQIIRFAGTADVLDVHVIADGREIAKLP